MAARGTTTGRRSTFINIEEWLDKCTNKEPDSIIYDPDFVEEFAHRKAEQLKSRAVAVYRAAAETCIKMGLQVQEVEERGFDMDDFYATCDEQMLKDINSEYDKLCQYKDELLHQVQKMTSDLYLPAYVPESNVTFLQYCKKLKAKFTELNQIREKRMKRLLELRDKQSKHCLVLGIKPSEVKMQTDIPTEDELSKLSVVVMDLEQEEKRRKDKYHLLKEMISKCMDELEYTPQSEFEEKILTEQPSYVESHLLKMSKLHSKLEAQYAINQAKYEKLIERLISLYDRLDVDQVERDAFFDTHGMCKPSILAEMEVEVERYEELKRQNIGKFIEKIKEELRDEYERCFITLEQQENFFSLSTVSGECNEEILELYEKELNRIKEFYRENKDIVDKFQKWSAMWKELMELEDKANDPNRFNNRGGQLLIEEKKRKTLQKGLPKIEKELILMNEKYSTQNDGKKFKVYDTNIDEFIAGIWDGLNEIKESQKRERQRAKMNEAATIRARKPVQSQVVLKRTPTKRAAGAGVTPTPSKLQCQRPMLTTPQNNTFKSSTQNLCTGSSVKKLSQRNIFQPSSNASSKSRIPSHGKSNLPVPILKGSTRRQQTDNKTTSNSNGSDFSALSLDEQEFESVIDTCPASAKRTK